MHKDVRQTVCLAESLLKTQHGNIAYIQITKLDKYVIVLLLSEIYITKIYSGIYLQGHMIQ